MYELFLKIITDLLKNIIKKHSILAEHSSRKLLVVSDVIYNYVAVD